MFYKFIKTNKKNILIILFLLLCVGIGISLKINSNKSISVANSTVKETDNSYVTLDDKVLDQSNLKEWKDKSKDKQGAYVASDSEYTYALITNGETKESDISLCLEKVQYGKYVDIEYFSLKGKDSVKTQSYIPNTLLLRFNGANRDIRFNQAENNN